ncbi:hypothetical protein [Stenotrophomonas sp.]|uniref:hypothetical protein n=1 Tax=Stenotrophomonas sp. TaxID=69392 RepID=UPI00289CC790|nr:hypothetical protein [Stenotrophomonas sp.]
MNSILLARYHDTEARLSRLVEPAAEGKSFDMAKVGKRIAEVTVFDSAAPVEIKRFGFMAAQISVPDDFDRMDEESLTVMLGGGDTSTQEADIRRAIALARSLED